MLLIHEQKNRSVEQNKKSKIIQHNVRDGRKKTENLKMNQQQLPNLNINRENKMLGGLKD